MARSTARVSPTALYTGEVWARNGLSHPALRTHTGRAFHAGLSPGMAVSQRLLGLSLEPFLLARHQAIDNLLSAAIDSGGITQVIEVASGLSPRGWRFAQRYGPAITYIETDLPGMTARKRAALAKTGSLDDHHRVEELDALASSGPASLGALTAGLDPERGLAIITEGLLPYLPADAVLTMWRGFATTLTRFGNGRYLSDLHLSEIDNGAVRLFRLGLSSFVRGRVELHWDRAAEAQRALLACGFDTATVVRSDRLVPEPKPGAELVHIAEATTRR